MLMLIESIQRIIFTQFGIDVIGF